MRCGGSSPARSIVPRRRRGWWWRPGSTRSGSAPGCGTSSRARTRRGSIPSPPTRRSGRRRGGAAIRPRPRGGPDGRRRRIVRIGITCYPTYGGSGALATELGIALAGRGHEVHFITYRQPFRLPAFLPRVYFHEVDVGRYPLFEFPPYDLALAVRMHEVTLAHHLDLLHVHYAIPHATSAWIAREMLRAGGADVPIVTTLHGTDITIVGQDPSFHAITKFSIERSSRITAVSHFLREETVRAFGCTGCRVDVIPNFVDPDVYDRARYAPVLRRELPNDGSILVH